MREANFLFAGNEHVQGPAEGLSSAGAPGQPALAAHPLAAARGHHNQSRPPCTCRRADSSSHPTCLRRALSGSSWGQRDYVDARCCCPPLSAHLLPRDASAASRKPPQVPAAFRSGSARMAALLGHPQHPWEGVPTSVCDLSGSVHRERANCHMCRLYKAYPTCTFEDTVKIPFLQLFLLHFSNK